MLKLSEFLEVPEGVEFKFEEGIVNFGNAVYKIINNELMCKTDIKWHQSNLSLKEILSAKATILPQQILTDAEEEFLKAVVKIYKNTPIVIIKGEEIIYIKKDNESYTLAAFDITEEMPFKNMIIDKEYTLTSLGLEE